MNAYVLIQTENGVRPIAEDVRQVPGVVSADDLRGPYDAIALASSSSTGEPVEHTVARIRNLPGVTRAVTARFVDATDTADGRAEETSGYAAA